MRNTEQPGMLKTPVGFQNLFPMHSPVCKSTEQTRTHRILRDSLKLGLNNEKTIYIMLPQHSDNHYEGGLRSDELGRKKNEKNICTQIH